MTGLGCAPCRLMQEGLRNRSPSACAIPPPARVLAEMSRMAVDWEHLQIGVSPHDLSLQAAAW